MLKLWHIAREGDAYGGSRNANKIVLALTRMQRVATGLARLLEVPSMR